MLCGQRIPAVNAQRLLLCLALALSFSGRAQVVGTNEIERVQREQYDELEHYFDARIAASANVRREAWQRDLTSPGAYEKSVEPWRERLWTLLGGKPTNAAPLAPKVELIAEFSTHTAHRVWLGAFDAVRTYGVLLVPRGGARSPALICVHGMAGTPEGVCGLTGQTDYHHAFGLQMVQRGYVVFAPLDLNSPPKRRWLDRKAIEVGERLQAIEQFKIVRVIDYLTTRADVDAKRIGAYGISWGGRTVMNLAALDRRVAACAISGHFNDLVPKMVTPSPHYTAFIETQEDYSFFYNHFNLFTDADVVSLICPRPVFIEQGRQDRVAWWEMSQRAFEPVAEIYRRLGIGERAVYSIFEGPHEIHGTEAFEFFAKWLGGLSSAAERKPDMNR